MQIEQMCWSERDGWVPEAPGSLGGAASLILVFGEAGALRNGTALAELRRWHPGVPLFGCSRPAGRRRPLGGESLVVDALRFQTTDVQVARTRVAGVEDSHRAGLRLALGLPSWGLTHVLVLFDGLRVDGAALVRGMSAALPSDAAIFGAPALDRDAPEEILVVGGSVAELGTAAVVGLYGTDVRVWHASDGIPFELDERSAAVSEPEFDPEACLAVRG